MLNSLRIGPLSTNQTDRPVPGEEDRIRFTRPFKSVEADSIALSADGKFLATVGDCLVRIWRLPEGELLHALHAGSGRVAFSPTAPLLAVGAGAPRLGDSDGCVKFYDLSQGAEVWALPDSGGHMAFARKNGGRMVTGSFDNQVKLWDATGPRLLRTFNNQGLAAGAAISEDGRRVAASGWGDLSVRVWDAETGREFACLAGHRDEVNAVAFHPNGTVVASASRLLGYTHRRASPRD